MCWRFFKNMGLLEIIMKRRVRCLGLTFVVLLFAMLTERPLLAKDLVPEDILTTKEIKKLVYGQTAEVAFVKTKEKGLFYFSPNGEFKQLINNWLEEGHWEVNKKDRLCISVAGGHWDCRMLVRNKESIGQYIVKKDGNHQLQLTCENFNDGNKLLELGATHLPPPWKN